MRKIELKISKLTLPSKNWPDFPCKEFVFYGVVHVDFVIYKL